MKKLFIILALIFTCTFVKAQEETVTGELSIWVENNPQNKFVSMTLELISPAAWDEDHYITELFNGGTESGYINNGWLEFLACWETRPEEYYRTFGLGLYKITAKINGVVKDHFYIDYRTSDLPGAIGVGCQIDYFLDFNVGTGKFYYRNTQNEFSGYHAFWDLRPCVEHKTDDLEDYWDNSLALIPDENDHPKIVWGPYPNEEFSVSYYKIYKKIGTQNFVLYDTTSDTEYTDTEETLVFGPPVANETIAKYKVTAYGNLRSSSTETGPSNEVEARIEGNPPEKINLTSAQLDVNNFVLEQNYPNPFNPSTIIKWQSPVDDLVTLKMYDLLGSEVAELVNTYKESGIHSVEFNASQLPSGIYFYKIQIGNYSETRKLILQK